MTSPVAPWPALAVRAYLLADARVVALDAKVRTRSPADVGPLHIVVQAPNAPGLDRPLHGLYRPLVLVEARAAKAKESGGDPEVEVMAAAAVLASVLADARNVTYENSRWTTQRGSGPFALPVDDSRSVPVYRGATQAELTMHVRRAT